MAKKKEENLVVPKVELKTPFAKKKEIFDEVIEDSLKQMGEDVDKEILEKIGKENNLITGFEDDFKGMYQEHILNLLDNIQTIERSKIDLIKECIENSQNLEAIVLLQQLQTGEQWKIQEIIQSLS